MGIPLEIRTGNLHLPMNSPVRFHLFIDGSVIEGFVNDEYAFTSRFFPKMQRMYRFSYIPRKERQKPK